MDAFYRSASPRCEKSKWKKHHTLLSKPQEQIQKRKGKGGFSYFWPSLSQLQRTQTQRPGTHLSVFFCGPTANNVDTISQERLQCHILMQIDVFIATGTTTGFH